MFEKFFNNMKSSDEIANDAISNVNILLNRIKELQDENEKLKNGIWKDNTLATLKKQVLSQGEQLRYGFGITYEEYQKIMDWRKSHPSKSFSYSFEHLGGIGVIGKVINEKGEEFIFQDVDKW